MSLFLVFIIVVVSFMASMFVFSQIRELWHAARMGHQMKNYTMMFWALVAILMLVGAMTIFILSMYDMVDGKFDMFFRGANNG